MASEMTALDPATGANRWSIDGWQAAGDLDGGRMLAFRAGGQAHAGIIDSTTGRLLGDLGLWTLVSGLDNHLVIQSIGDGTRSSWIGVVDLVRATVRPVGKLDDLRSRGCVSRGDVLACITLDSSVRVWRYESAR
jgi:hypothetical protein